MTRYIGIQYLRGAAALLVIVYHAMMMAAVAKYYERAYGDFGVDIFFVISGFIMWATTERANITTKSFMLSRAVRIIPLYWIFTIIMVTAIIAVPTLFINSRGIDVEYIVRSMLFIPSISPDTNEIAPIYSIGWTLIYEAFFYVLFGACLFFKGQNQRIFALTAAIVGLTTFGFIFKPESPILATYTSPTILEFLYGVLIGFFRTHIQRAHRPTAILLAVVMFALLLSFEATQANRFFYYGIPAAVLVGCFVALEDNFRKIPFKTAEYLGEISYSLYLSHPISQRIWLVSLTSIAGLGISGETAIFYSVGAVIFGVIGGIACYHIAEKPCLVFGKKLIARNNVSRPGISQVL